MQNILKFAVRSAVWKRTAEPPLVGLFTLISCTLLAFAIGLVVQYIDAEGAVRFSPYGLNAEFTRFVILLVVSSLFVRPHWRATVLSTLTLIACVAWLASTGAVIAQRHLPWTLPAPWPWMSNNSASFIFLLHFVWWLGAMVTTFRSVEPERRLASVRALALWGASLASIAILPYYPDVSRRAI